MDYAVRAAAGANRPKGGGPVEFTLEVPNSRAEATSFTAAFTGGHLLHLAVAACLLNDLYREAEILGVTLESASVTARGTFSGSPAVSDGVRYSIEATGTPAEAVPGLIARVEEVAEIPATLRQSTRVESDRPLPRRARQEQS